ncbi:MAG: preprotein translocase subunit YajC [Planctomycetota bacterium]
MIDRLAWTVTLAQDAAPAEPPPPTGVDVTVPPGGEATVTVDANGQTVTTNAPPPSSGFDPTFIILMVGVIVIMYVVVFGGSRREKKRKAQMLDAMGKGDRVQTVGGVLGTVMDVNENEVVLKVDENTNARVRFAKSAIQTVLESSD